MGRHFRVIHGIVLAVVVALGTVGCESDTTGVARDNCRAAVEHRLDTAGDTSFSDEDIENDQPDFEIRGIVEVDEVSGDPARFSFHCTLHRAAGAEKLDIDVGFVRVRKES
jgi:hypothetical protein